MCPFFKKMIKIAFWHIEWEYVYFDFWFLIFFLNFSYIYFWDFTQNFDEMYILFYYSKIPFNMLSRDLKLKSMVDFKF